MKHLLLLSALCLAGCADSYTDMYLNDQTGAQSQCTLTNNVGSWHLTTPGWVKVKNSPYPMAIACESEGHTARYSVNAPYAYRHFVAAIEPKCHDLVARIPENGEGIQPCKNLGQ